MNRIIVDINMEEQGVNGTRQTPNTSVGKSGEMFNTPHFRNNAEPSLSKLSLSSPTPIKGPPRIHSKHNLLHHEFAREDEAEMSKSFNDVSPRENKFLALAKFGTGIPESCHSENYKVSDNANNNVNLYASANICSQMQHGRASIPTSRNMGIEVKPDTVLKMDTDDNEGDKSVSDPHPSKRKRNSTNEGINANDECTGSTKSDEGDLNTSGLEFKPQRLEPLNNDVASMDRSRSVATSTIDFLSVQLSTDDEYSNEQERFKSFFEMDDAFSIFTSQNSNFDLRINEVQAGIICTTTTPTKVQMKFSSSRNMSNPSLRSFCSNARSSLQDDVTGKFSIDQLVAHENNQAVAETGSILTSESRVDSPSLYSSDPPPYTPFIEKSESCSTSSLKEEDKRSGSAISLLKRNLNSPCGSGGPVSPMKRKNNLSVNVFIPPYRSLINPHRGYDYITRRVINVAEYEFPIGHNSLLRKKKESKIKSLLSGTSKMIKNATNASPDKYKSTTQFKELPSDVVKRIIGMVTDQRDLVNCLYVNKEFHKYSKQNLYRYPKFTSSYRFAQFVHAIMNNHELPPLVEVFDLSMITTPISLTAAEKTRYQDKLVYGTTAAMDVLNDKSRVVYAGWRDWKYRNNPQYNGSIDWRTRRSNSLSAISSLPRPHFELIDGRNHSFNSLVEMRRYKTNSSSSSSFSLLTGKGKKEGKKRSQDCKALRKRSNSLPKIKDSSSRGDNSLFKALKKSFSREKSTKQKDEFRRSSVNVVGGGCSGREGTMRRRGNRGSVGVKFGGKSVEVVSARVVPFEKPHPRMNDMLKQYCFHRDVPIGYVMHVLMECRQLREINFNHVLLSTDYEMKDYSSFNHATGKGTTMYASYGKKPVRLNASRPIFWSDTDRDTNINDGKFIEGFIESVPFRDVWRCFLEQENIERLFLERLKPIEQSTINEFLFHSRFRERLQMLSCYKSGMVRREEWNVLKEAQEWREYIAGDDS